jgi:hypothetical protein
MAWSEVENTLRFERVTVPNWQASLAVWGSAGLTTGVEGRLPPGLALLVIGGFSLLSCSVLIALFKVLQAII